MLQAFIFDLDGTLVDTHRANYEAYKHALEAEGISINWNDFKQTIGMQSGMFLPILAPGLSEETYKNIRGAKAVHYKDVTHLTEPNTSLITFMKSLAVHHKIALVTTAQRQSAELILKQHNLLAYFDVIITANDVMEHKPSPEGYKKALDQLNVHAESALAFEDSKTGIAAAEAAGLKVVNVKDFLS